MQIESNDVDTHDDVRVRFNLLTFHAPNRRCDEIVMHLLTHPSVFSSQNVNRSNMR